MSLSDSHRTDRLLRWAVGLAGLLGAAGVAAAAAAAHLPESRPLAAAAAVCLANAPALLVLGLHGRRLRWGRLCAGLLALGTVLFAGDLGLRVLLGHRLFPMAAPVGGSTMIVAWLLIAASALLHSERT